MFLLSGCSFLGYAAQVQQIRVPDTAVTMDEVVRHSDSSDLKDPIALFQKGLDKGTKKLDFDSKYGYLTSVLKAFEIPVSSQTLVFSKTSTQADHTSPKTPRALYFNDKVYIGFAHGDANLDVLSIDPQKGAIFYTLKQFKGVPPRFIRQDACFNCHFGPKTADVPGLFLRSISTEKDGTPVGQVNDFVAGHNSPLKMRWGGWYVTGTHGKDEHLGNVFLGRVKDFNKLDLAKSSNVTDLSPYFDTSLYLTPHSDSVALLVLDHSTRMQNLIIQANFESKQALHDREQIRVKGLDASRDWSEKRISQVGEMMVAHMLFRDESKLNGPIKGTSNFQEEFSRRGPFDSKGRSLRQFDLNTRLFRYPCSFLIYSESFDGLPKVAKEYTWKRFIEILTGKDQTLLYSTLESQDRSAVFDILLETKPEFRDYFVKYSSKSR